MRTSGTSEQPSRPLRNALRRLFRTREQLRARQETGEGASEEFLARSHRDARTALTKILARHGLVRELAERWVDVALAAEDEEEAEISLSRRVAALEASTGV